MDFSLPMNVTFYQVAIPAVMMTGMAKGGLGGAMAMLGTPLIALAISPVQAAAIMLPILLFMDAMSLYAYWGVVKWSIIRAMIPGAIIGITIGWATASLVSDSAIKIIIGVIAVSFALLLLIREFRKTSPATENTGLGAFWGIFAGFTSFVSHAGGPPFQAYTVPLKLEPRLYVGTSVVFFAIVNSIKVAPYFALGEFSLTNMQASASLFPVAIAGVFFGVWGVKRLPAHLFYHLTYAVMLIVGSKLIYDGISAL